MIKNIELVSMLLGIVAGLQVINIVLGSLDAMLEKNFNWKKFFYGIFKALVNALCIVGTCALADLFAEILNMIEGITISVEIVSSIEIISVVVIWCVDLFKDILEKIKKTKELKYVSYDDIHYNDGSGVSE